MRKKTVGMINFTPYDLRVNNLSGKVWLGTTQPNLSWKMRHRSGTMQKAYRIQAASSSAALNKPDLWDSGWIESEQSISIPWGGPQLSSRQRIFWLVTLQDQSGKVSRPSEPAEFEIALIHNTDWKAHWIHYDGNNPSCPSPCPYFRREFSVGKPVKRAVLYVTARGLFEVIQLNYLK